MAPTGSELPNGVSGGIPESSSIASIAQARRSGRLLSRILSERPEAIEAEKQAKSKRLNQMMIVYIFVALTIIGSWGIGCLGFGFTWVIGLLGCVFYLWHRKTTALLEQAIRDKEVLLHRRRNLRQSETAEWLNFILNRWWVFSASSISDVIKKNLEPLLQDIKPAILDSVEVMSFSLGEKTPFIRHATVYEYADGGKKPMSFSSVVQPPPGLEQAQLYQVVVEVDTALHCDDFNMVFRSRLGGKRMGMNLDIAVQQLNIEGKLQLILHMDRDQAFPHIACVTLSFVQKPEVWFSLRVLKAVQMMELPLLKNWIHSVVMGGLTEALVDPGKMDIKIERMGPTNIPETGRSSCRAAGVLTVTIDGEYIRGIAFVEDVRYCQVRVGDQKRHTAHVHAWDEWRETMSFLVSDLKTDVLTFKCKSKFLLTLTTLAAFDVRLADYPLEHQPIAETVFESKLSKGKFGSDAAVKLKVSMTYSALPQIEQAIENGGIPASPLGYQPRPLSPPTESVSGVLYICVHGAEGLLGLDRNGFSDPYCVVYCNGKKLKTTHYVERTKNPRWDVSTEVLVSDCTQTILYFILYDWDGASPSEDDFLGSAHFILPKEEKSVVRRTLTLGYNLLNVGQVENTKLGSVTVSVIFRPVADVHTEKSANPFQRTDSVHPTTYKSKGLIKQASTSRDDSVKGKQKLGPKRSSTVKNSLSMGCGIFELNIYQAKDLVSADRNGLSDPYCEVRVGGERKFTTSTKKKTLAPVWDEWVTLQMPRQDETLEITVWDKDAFFQKDFLGSVIFSLHDLRLYSTENKAQSWFELQRTAHGWIQVFFSVISEDVKAEEPESPLTMKDIPVFPDQLPKQEHSPLEVTSNGRGGSAPPDLIKSNADIDSAQKTGQAEDGTGNHVTDDSSKTPQKPKTPLSQQNEEEEFSTPMASLPAASDNSTTRANNSEASPSPAVPIQSQQSSPSPVDSSASESVSQRANSLNSPRDRSVSQSNSVASLAPGERIYWVAGQLLQVRGIGPSVSSIYCKVRLDNRSPAQRSRKPGASRIITKTPTFNMSSYAAFNHSFQLDDGHGVGKEALIIFDIKTSHRDHLAIRAFTLQELLQDEQAITRWVLLERGVELQVFLSHGNHNGDEDTGSMALGIRKSRFGSFRSKFRKNKVQ